MNVPASGSEEESVGSACKGRGAWTELDHDDDQPMGFPGVRIGTAGWSIPKQHAATFPREGSHLRRYGAILDAVEINSSFYNHHRPVTYQRWAACVPEHFRFAVKVPKSITHERRLRDVDHVLDRFISEVAGLGHKLGPLLVQLPPSLLFERPLAERFLRSLRSRVVGGIVCEPRHVS